MRSNPAGSHIPFAILNSSLQHNGYYVVAHKNQQDIS